MTVSLNYITLRYTANIRERLIGTATITFSKTAAGTKPPYLILHKRGEISNMSNPVPRVFDNIGSKYVTF